MSKYNNMSELEFSKEVYTRVYKKTVHAQRDKDGKVFNYYTDRPDGNMMLPFYCTDQNSASRAVVEVLKDSDDKRYQCTGRAPAGEGEMEYMAWVNNSCSGWHKQKAKAICVAVLKFLDGDG